MTQTTLPVSTYGSRPLQLIRRRDRVPRVQNGLRQCPVPDLKIPDNPAKLAAFAMVLSAEEHVARPHREKRFNEPPGGKTFFLFLRVPRSNLTRIDPDQTYPLIFQRNLEAKVNVDVDSIAIDHTDDRRSVPIHVGRNYQETNA